MTLMTNDLNDHFLEEGGKRKTVGGREKRKPVGGREERKTVGGREERKTVGGREKRKTVGVPADLKSADKKARPISLRI